MSALPQPIVAAVHPARQRAPRLARREAITGLTFLSPWLVGLLVFTIVPMVASLGLSFTDYNLIYPEKTKFIGVENYLQLFRDPAARRSIFITLRFLIFAVPIQMVVSLGLAALLNSKHLLGQRVFRTLFFLPYIVPFISTIFIWQGVLNSKTGWVNLTLTATGLPAPDWLQSTTWIYPALILVNLWGIGNIFLTLLAGMQGVPTELYDAAHVDGAGPVQTFLNVTVPMISPVIFYNLVLTLIGFFQYFLVPFILVGSNGEPGGATFFFNLYLFKSFFTYQDMAYGATLAWVLFIVALATTALVFGSARYWVYYAGGREE